MQCNLLAVGKCSRARIIEEWEQLVETTASNVIGEKLIVCNRAVKWWDEGVKRGSKRAGIGIRNIYQYIE